MTKAIREWQSPRLVKHKYDLVDSEKKQWFCLYELREYVEIPEAEFYWVRVRDTQWANDCGVRIRVGRNRYGLWRLSDITPDGQSFCSTVEVALDAWFGITDPYAVVDATIYFVLLYQEK